MKKGLKLLRGEVIGAYPALRDPGVSACCNPYHAVALANISSLREIRPGGWVGNTIWLWAHGLWGTEAPRTRLAAGPLCSFHIYHTLRCLVLVRGLIQWSAGPAFLRCWHNGFNQPVLKHGPRSLTRMRVVRWQTLDAK